MRKAHSFLLGSVITRMLNEGGDIRGGISPVNIALEGFSNFGGFSIFFGGGGREGISLC